VVATKALLLLHKQLFVISLEKPRGRLTGMEERYDGANCFILASAEKSNLGFEKTKPHQLQKLRQN